MLVMATPVMPGLVPGIHVFAAGEIVDGRDEPRDKPGHDVENRSVAFVPSQFTAGMRNAVSLT